MIHASPDAGTQKGSATVTTWYHYTTPGGFQGIIETKSIWATEYRFLNDATELRYALNVFEEVVKREKARLDAVSAEIAELIHELERASRDHHAFITSFSENGDLLSQWRGYTKAAGFSLGFHPDWIIQNAHKQGFVDVPVVYRPAEQEEVVSKRLTLLLNLVADARQKSEKPIRAVVERWWGVMMTTLPAIKSENFFEEHERRLVKVFDQWPHGDIETRYNDSGLVPYIRFKLDYFINDNPVFQPTENVGLKEIKTGPGLHERQLLATEALLTRHRMQIPVTRSRITYIAN